MSKKIAKRLSLSLFFTACFLATIIAILIFRPHYKEKLAIKFSLAENIKKRSNGQTFATYKENVQNFWFNEKNKLIVGNHIKEQITAKGEIRYKKNIFYPNDEWTSFEDSSGTLIERANGEIWVYSRDELNAGTDQDKQKLDILETKLKELPLANSYDLRASIASSNSGSKWKIYIYSDAELDEKQILSCPDFNIVKMRKGENIKYIFLSKNYSKQYLISIKGDENFYLAKQEAFSSDFSPLAIKCSDSKLIKECIKAISLLDYYCQSLIKSISSLNHLSQLDETLKKYQLIT